MATRTERAIIKTLTTHYIDGAFVESHSQVLADRVAINGLLDDQQAPFGGFKNSGVGREFGTYGIEGFLELRAILES